MIVIRPGGLDMCEILIGTEATSTSEQSCESFVAPSPVIIPAFSCSRIKWHAIYCNTESDSSSLAGVYVCWCWMQGDTKMIILRGNSVGIATIRESARGVIRKTISVDISITGPDFNFTNALCWSLSE